MNENEIIEAEVLVDEPEAAPKEATAPDETEALRLRISELESELMGYTAKSEKEKNERDYFHSVFPDVDPDTLPDEVVAQKNSGIPLAAAYALYERIRENEMRAAAEANRYNAANLHGSVSGHRGEPFFSADEVKKMSSDQVKKNFSGILSSMKHWGK